MIPLLGPEKSMFWQLAPVTTSPPLPYLYKHQGGFRKNKSTIKTIHKLANDIAMATNRAEHTIALFLGVSKASDTINHDLLLDKINKEIIIIN